MLDGAARKLFDPIFNGIARYLAKTGISANAITLTAGAIGLGVLVPLALQNYLLALTLILVNRLLDALDGAVARRNGITDLGGFFDVVGDFIFFGAVVLGFALADPDANALAASWLLFAFMGTAASFLAYAALAEKSDFHTESHGQKSIFFLGGLVEVAAELREGRHLAVLGEIELERTRDRLGGFGLGRTAHPLNRNAHVHGGPHAGVEEVALEKDLTIGDRNDVGRNVGRNVTRLGLDDRQRGEASAALFVTHLRRAFEQPRVHVEDVARVGFASGRSAQQQ